MFKDIDMGTVAITALIGAMVVWAAKQTAKAAVDGVKEVGEAINPLNDENVFNKGATNAYQNITGSDQSMGADLYDYMHPDTFREPTKEEIQAGVKKYGRIEYLKMVDKARQEANDKPWYKKVF